MSSASDLPGRLARSAARAAYRTVWPVARPVLGPVVRPAAQRVVTAAAVRGWVNVPPAQPQVPTAEPGSAEAATGRRSRGFGDFNEMLHELRSIEMSRMPRTDGTVLSAGASGTLYFEWITRCYGPIKRHIGLELYLAEPAELPEGVEWLKRSVSNMEGVPDGSIGLIFSGQNFEHLFGDDAAGFLLESHRVLEVGGQLVIDSPNRDITSPQCWNMPEHTIEFTVDEAIDLVTLAGFDVNSVRGLWLCRDDKTGEVLPWWDDTDPPDAAEVTRRAVLGIDRPQDCFVWWLEATRADRAPDERALRRRHAEIFDIAWPERLQRVRYLVGEKRFELGVPYVSAEAGTAGHLLFGPYAPLTPGSYEVTLWLRAPGKSSESGGREPDALAELDITSVTGDLALARTLTADDFPDDGWTPVTLAFQVDDLQWGVEFRVVSTGARALEVQQRVALKEEGTSVAPTREV